MNPIKNPLWSLAAVAICAAGLLATMVTFRLLPTTVRVEVVESKHVPADLVNYVMPYVASYMTLDYDQGPKLLGFGIFLMWIFDQLQVRADRYESGARSSRLVTF